MTGLRLGRRYRFTVQPTFPSGVAAETFVDERTGNLFSPNPTYSLCSYSPEVHSPSQTVFSAVCLGGRLDVVFLVPASTDRIDLERPLRELLTSAAGSLATIGPRDSQVFLINKSQKYHK